MAITSTSGMQGVTQAAWKLLQVEQARQFAERAAQNARALQSKASEAQSEADRALENARTLKVDANEAQSIAVQADRGVRSTESAGQVGSQIVMKITQVAQVQEATPAQAPSTVNTQGETIGTVINVTA